MNRHYFPAVRGRFGDWAYYSTLMPLEQMVKRIGFASQIHKSESLSQLIQRELKGGRAKEIARYIQDNSDRFFNSLVVAIYGGDPAWHAIDVSAKSDDIALDDLDETALYSIGYLSLTETEKIFAVDGQHRLAGIREALRENDNLGKEELPVIFVAHHNTDEGRRRTRNLFTTLNKAARAVSKPEIIALDEADIMAISTRHLVENHPYFSRGQIDVLRKQANLAPTNYEHLTTIISLYDLLSVVFSSIKERLSREKSADLRIYRPPDEKVEEYNRFAAHYFELLANSFYPLKDYFEADNPKVVIKKYRGRDGGNVLFRPVGLRILTETVKELRSKLSLDEAMRLLAQLPTELNSAPYVGTVWNRTERKVVISRSALCRNVLLHMLGHYRKNIIELRRAYAEALGSTPDQVGLPDPVVQ